jgi:ATP-binding protein involved in chromosome partitioning
MSWWKSAFVSREKLEKALNSVRDPQLDKGILVSGRVQGLTLRDDGKVGFVIELGTLDQEQGMALQRQAQAAAKRVKGVSDVTAVLTAHASPSSNPSPRSQAGPSRPTFDTGGMSPIPTTRRVQKGARLSDEAIAQSTPRARTVLPMPGVRFIIAVASAKGGVGKSTVAANLACALAHNGLKVGLLDGDIYGPSVPTLFGTGEARPQNEADKKLIPIMAHGLKTMSMGYLVDLDAPMIWRGPIVMSALTQMLNDVAWAPADSPLDILVIDTPPGTGDAILSLVQKVPLDGAIIVSTPQEVALADVRRGVAMFRKTEIPILGIVENMAWFEDPVSGTRNHIFGEGGARRTAEATQCPFLGEIPLEPSLRASGDAGAPLVITDPDGATARRFIAMAHQIEAALKHGGHIKPPPTIRFVNA